jgi:hypothetical protein
MTTEAPAPKPAGPVRDVPVDWEALEDAFENNAPEVHSYLHLATGDVLRVVDGVADPQMHARINGDTNYLRIAPVSSREQYRWMERYIPMVEETDLRGKLAASIDGKGAFRRFKDVLMTHGVERERWFAFRSERLRTFMEAWLVAHALNAIPRPQWPQGQPENAPTETASADAPVDPAAPPQVDTRERRGRNADSLRKHLREVIDGLGPRDLETLSAFGDFLKARRIARAYAHHHDHHADGNYDDGPASTDTPAEAPVDVTSLAPEQPSARGRRGVDGTVQDDLASCRATVRVRLRRPTASVRDVANARVPPPEEAVEIAVANPDEPRPLVLDRLFAQLLGEALHHARDVLLPVAIAADRVRLPVLPPQSLGRLAQERVRVLGHLEVRVRSADLEHRPALALHGAIRGHPDRLDEEVIGEDVRQDPIRLDHAPRRRAEVPIPVALRPRRRVEVVLEHQLLRRAHRRLRFVLVGALGQREQRVNPRQHPLFLAARRPFGLGHPRRPSVDAETLAHLLERRAVRILVRRAEHLVRVLMRHLVLQHLEHDAPGLRHEQPSRQLDRATITAPQAEPSIGIVELDRRRAQGLAEVLPVDRVPRAVQLADGGGFELGGELGSVASVRVHPDGVPPCLPVVNGVPPCLPVVNGEQTRFSYDLTAHRS